MNSFRIFDRQARRIVAAVALLTATITPALVPAFASAATVTGRSVELSSSTKATASVSYKVNFTTIVSSTGAFEVDFCTTAAIGTTCTVPSGFSTSGVGTTGSDTVSATNTNTGVKVVLASAASASTNVSVELTGIHNPTNSGVIYARIVTYTDGTLPASSGNWNYTAPDNLGTYLDSGSVALNITDGFSVGGDVRETLVFCASGSASAIGTGCSTNVTSPNLTLAGASGALETTASEGTIKTQVSSNAANGVAVWLKNSTPGGGMKRAEAATSDIVPLTGTPPATFPDGSGKFGLKLANLTGGTVASGSYSTGTYFLEYASNNLSGVTSAYGSQIYDTGNSPISDGTADLTFAAATSNLTPAGSYSAALNLIATGKF